MKNWGVKQAATFLTQQYGGRAKFLLGLLLGVVPFVSLSAKKPNVVVILIDDISHYGVTAYGANKISSTEGFFSNTEFETPRIDSIGKDGLRCENAYAYPLCEPSRVALMSGMNNVRNYHQCKSQHASDITFGDLFQREGYKTCIVGKWKQTRGTKEVSGKDYIFEFGWDEFSCFDVVGEGKRMIDPDIVENGKMMNYKGIDPVTGRRFYGPDIFNRYALDFIKRNQNDPFFLYYSMVLVHDEHTPTPDTRPKKIFDEFDIKNKGDYGFMTGDDRHYFPDMLAYMDKMVGKVLDQLDALGLAENTMVVVMGDNGTKECFAHVMPDGEVFTGGKGGNKENGMHVPLLVKLPGKIPSGKVYDGLVNLTDIFPTLCSAAGIEHPYAENLDGISFWPQATGESDSDHRDFIYTWYNGNRPSTETDLIIEYAFNKDFKFYSPDKEFPNGRFFDLREDRLEEVGDRKVAVKKAWKKWHYSGLKLEDLTSEQRKAYNDLKSVIDKKKYVPVKEIRISKAELSLLPKQSDILDCSVLPLNASRRGLIWESSDSAVATVDKFGKITAHKAGSATITAYSWDDAYPVASNAKEAYSRKGIKDKISIRVAHP